MVKKINLYSIIIISILCSIFSAEKLLASESDSIFKNLSLSGYLMMRHWHMASKTAVPDSFPDDTNYATINYEDMFFRNRLDLKISSAVEIKSVFDIYALFGKDDFSLGNASTNLITRDVYAVIKFPPNSRLEIGLKPFSFPGGYILAKDATGAEYSHSAFNGTVKTSLGFIKAFDDADDRYGEQSGKSEYRYDNILFLDCILSLSQDVSAQAYYVHENDRYVDSEKDDNRKAALHWLAMHTRIVSGNFFLKLVLIYNWGLLYIKDENTNQFGRTGVSAGLFSLQSGYKFNNMQINLVAEGATGDPDNSSYGGSFQDIKASRGYSYIVVDNIGGIALRGSGESSWYGMYSCGVKTKFTLFDLIEMNLNYLHFRTTKELERKEIRSRWLGDEIDIKAEYKYHEALSIFSTAGIFFPHDAYTALASVNSRSKSAIIEIMFGAQISY